MNIAETIKQTREARGLTQEDLAERCEVSRQAVSKWEVGSSVPTPENLKTLGEILEVTFETEEGKEAPPSAPRPPFWNWKRTALLVLGMLVVSALFSIAMWTALKTGKNVDVPRPLNPIITGMDFFGEDGTPLDPDLGDGWKSFTVGQRVYLLVIFQQGTETLNVTAVTVEEIGGQTYEWDHSVDASQDRSVTGEILANDSLLPISR